MYMDVFQWFEELVSFYIYHLIIIWEWIQMYRGGM